MPPSCSQELDAGNAQPYFIWDVPVTVDQLRGYLAQGDEEQRFLWMARILREARFDDVWRFISIHDLLAAWPRVAARLGRRRAFWTWMLDRWRADGLIP